MFRLPPDAPAEPVVDAATATSLAVHWTTPSSKSAQVLGYELWAGADANVTTATRVYRGTALAFVLRDLYASETWCFHVRAWSGVGMGNFSNATCSDTAASGAPLPPSRVWPTASSRSSLTLQWDGAFYNGSRVLGFVVEQQESRLGAFAPGCNATAATPKVQECRGGKRTERKERGGGGGGGRHTHTHT